MAEVGREIRRLREAKGWNQAELAVHAGIGVSGLSHIETGKRNPSAATLQKIAEALGVGVGDLYPKAQAPLPFEQTQKATTGGDGLTLEDVRRFLENRLGSAWLALPDEEWDHWWKGVTREEVVNRYRQIGAEREAIMYEFDALIKGGPTSLPRGGNIIEMYNKLFSRWFEARYLVPRPEESDEEFQRRRLEGRHFRTFYEEFQPMKEQQATDRHEKRAGA